MTRWLLGIAVTFFLANVAFAQEPIVAVKVTPEEAAFKDSSSTKPIVIKSEDEARKYFGKEALATIAKGVDFKKQFMLVFAWKGSGCDRLSHVVAESFPEQISFSLQPGRTDDLRTHIHVYALRSNVKWSVKGKGDDKGK
jgi:hypothetical protein